MYVEYIILLKQNALTTLEHNYGMLMYIHNIIEEIDILNSTVIERNNFHKFINF